MQRSRALIAVTLAFCVSGCTVGPNYKRPDVDVPTTYRAAPANDAAANSAPALGEAKWFEVFQDEQLQNLIRVALQQNFDLRIAATRVLQAQAQLGITRADQFPNLSAGAGIGTSRQAATVLFHGFEETTGQVSLSASWELDFWGKYRRATEAARANLLASEWGRRAVVNTVISNVATTYFELRALDLQLEISKQTLASRQDSLKLEQALEQNGSTSLVDVRQSEQLVSSVFAPVASISRSFTSIVR